MIVGKIEAVIFDVDRTLWDFDKNSREVLSEIFLPISKKSKVPIERIVHVYEHYNFLLWAKYQKNQIDQSELRYHRFASVMKHFDCFDEEQVLEMAETYVDLCPKKLSLVDGAIDVLEYLKAKYPLYIISNGFGPVQHIKLNNTKLTPYFGLVVCPDTVGCKKPCKKIFHYTTGRAKIKNVSSALYIGDEFSTDFVGAVNAGLQAIHFDVHETHQTTKRIGHLSELKAIL